MGEHAPQSSQVIISSSRTLRRTCSYQNFSLFCDTFRILARFRLWLWTSGPPTCSMDPDEYSCPSNTAHTNAIASVAPNSAANASAELGHTGTSTPASRRMPKFSVKVPKGFPRDSTNLRVKQADAVMLSYLLGVQYHRRTTQQRERLRFTLRSERQPLRALKDISWRWRQRCSPPHLPLQFNPNIWTATWTPLPRHVHRERRVRWRRFATSTKFNCPAVQPRHVDDHVNSRAQRVTSHTICAVVHLCDARSADSNTPDRRSSKASRTGCLDGAVFKWSFARRRGSSKNSAAEHHKAMAALVQQLSAHANARSAAAGNAERRAGSAAAGRLCPRYILEHRVWCLPKTQLISLVSGGSSSKNPGQISRSPGTQEPTHSLSSAALSCWRS